MPDASIMLELATIPDISVNELLTGSIIKKDEYMRVAEKNLIELKKENEKNIKKLLQLEVVIGLTSSIIFFLIIMIAAIFINNLLVRIILISVATLIFITGCLCCLKIEQQAGYYECKICHYKYMPNYSSVFFSIHSGRNRYLKCPKCGKKSMNRKVISKE